MPLRYTPDDLPLTLGYALNPLDRMSDQRAEADWVAERWQAANACFIVFAGDRVLLNQQSPDAASVTFSAEDVAAFGVGPRVARAETSVFLGLSGAMPAASDRGNPAGRAPLFACLSDIEPEALEARGIAHIDLRSLVTSGIVPAAEAGAVAQGRSLLNWHGSHGFCSKCGAPSILSQGGYRRDCPACGTQHFPRTDPVVIMAVTRDDRILLGRQARFLPGMYSCLAGFLEPGETIEDAVRRETWEEAGMRVGRVAYHSSQPWPFPNTLMIGCFGEALDEAIFPDRNELEDCRWFTRAEVRAMLDGTHAEGFSSPKPIAIAHHLVRTFVSDI